MLISESATDFFDNLSDLRLDNDSDNRTKIIAIYKLLKKFYKSILVNEARHFSTLLAGISYIHDKYELNEELEKKYFSLASLYRKILKNKKISPSNDDYLFALKYSALIVKKISGFDLSSDLEDFVKSIPELNILKIHKTANQKIDIIGAIVSENPFYRKKITAPYIELICKHDEMGTFLLKIGQPYLENANMIYPNMCFNLINADIIRKEPMTLSTQNNAHFVFEPDYLIDATELAESYGLENAYKISFIKRYFSVGISYALVMGNLVNSMFDELLINPNTDFETAKMNAFQNKPLNIFAVTFKGLVKNSVINRELEEHFSKIKNVVDTILNVNYQNAIFSVESSFISTQYGVQGRLDFLAEYDDDPLRKDIIELKSGNSPVVTFSIMLDGKKIPVGVWVNHLAQVIAYNILLDSTFPGRKGNSSILYIKTDVQPLRDVADLPNVIIKLVTHRNNIILLENAVANGSFKFFENISNLAGGSMPPYIADKINEFASLLQSLNDIEKAYLYEMSAFIIRESFAVKTGLILDNGNNSNSALWNESPEDKIQNNNIISNLTLLPDESDFDNLHLTFKTNQTDFYSSFRKGDIGVLFSYIDEDEINKISNQLLKCTVKSIEADKIVISLRNKLVSGKLFNPNLLWRLEPDTIDTIDKLSFASVFDFLKSSKHKKDLIFGNVAPGFIQQTIENIDGLNSNQMEIVQKALSSDDYFLIQGPPGTGKTNVLIKTIVQQILTSSSEILLITAYTNRAVDELSYALSSISETADFVRIGSKDASDDYERHLPKIIEKYGMKEAYNRLLNARIIISTVASVMTNREIFDLKKFDTLIVDEASQILEPQLVGLISRCKRFMLIGDEKQLPPVVVQNNAGKKCNSELLNSIGLLNFSDSLFERLIRTCQLNGYNDGYGQLEYQARMHVEIQDFPNRYFYKNTLKHAFEKQTANISNFNSDGNNELEKMLSAGRMLFIDCPVGKGKASKTEAETTIKIINFISEKIQLTNETIGIISPFRMQCFEIYKRMNESQKQLITVDTVERFQGSQRDFIILSMSVNNKELLERAVSEDSAMTTDRKLNVAITRAKSHFILLGNSYILSQSKYYNSLINHIKSENNYYKWNDLFGFTDLTL